MGRVADGEEAGTRPVREPIERDRQQFDVVEALERFDRRDKEWRRSDHAAAELVNAAGLDGVGAALRNHERALPVVATIDQHQDAPRAEYAGGLIIGFLRFRHPKPEHVHRCAEILTMQTCSLTQTRVAAVGGDDELCAYRRAIRELDAGDATVADDKINRFGLHAQCKRLETARRRADEIEELPL